MTDGYQQVLAANEVAALELTDALISRPGELPADLKKRLLSHFTEAELVELSVVVGLFLGMSKVLITLGLEPDTMPVTVIPTPGS